MVVPRAFRQNTRKLPAGAAIMSEHQRYADFYKIEYARNAQEHRALWANGPSIFKAYARPPGDYLEPPVADITLQLCTRGFGGEARLDLNAGGFRAAERRGLFVVTPAAESCRYIIRDALDLLVIPFDPASVAEVTDGRGLVEGLYSRGWQDDAILNLAETLWSSIRQGDNQLFAEYLRLTILARLRQSAHQSTPFSCASLNRRQVQRVIAMFEADLSRNFALSTLAAEIGASPFHFARAFKSATGVPPHRYLIQLRLDKACKLLETTDLPITDIAAQVGYDDTGYLSRLFRAHLGTTPANYRRTIRS
jgi:AraC family transcriptional regulator